MNTEKNLAKQIKEDIIRCKGGKKMVDNMITHPRLQEIKAPAHVAIFSYVGDV